MDTKTFEVQSSANGTNFISIGNLAATGTPNYSFSDNHPLGYRTFYRLIIRDADGGFTYSPTIVINTNQNSNISLYPNPVKKTAMLNISNGMSLISTQAKLSDANGRLVEFFNINNNQQLINIERLPAGLYFLKLKDGSVINIFKK